MIKDLFIIGVPIFILLWVFYSFWKATASSYSFDRQHAPEILKDIQNDPEAMEQARKLADVEDRESIIRGRK